MAVTASQLRADIYRLLDEVLETGVPLEIQHKSGTLRIIADEQPSKVARLVPHPGYIVGDPDDLVDTDCSEHWDPATNSMVTGITPLKSQGKGSA